MTFSKLLYSTLNVNIGKIFKFQQINKYNYRNKTDVFSNQTTSIRSTKYNTFHVVEDMLKSDSPDLSTGVLLARLPRCINRDIIENLDFINSLNQINEFDDSNENLVDNLIENSDDNEINVIKQSLIKLEKSQISNNQNFQNPLRMPAETTYLFVKSRILFPDEWYLPTLFAANCLIKDIFKISETTSFTSPFPSVAIHERIPSTHPLFNKLKKSVHVFVYRAIFHGIHQLEYDKDIIQDVQWLTIEEAKKTIKFDFYKKLVPIF